MFKKILIILFLFSILSSVNGYIFQLNVDDGIDYEAYYYENGTMCEELHIVLFPFTSYGGTEHLRFYHNNNSGNGSRPLYDFMLPYTENCSVQWITRGNYPGWLNYYCDMDYKVVTPFTIDESVLPMEYWY